MTGIEWTDQTWNPVTGCTKVSPGCQHCYAERLAARLAGRAGYPADEPFRPTRHPDRLTQPLRWRRPRRVFVCSMADLFHPDVPDEYLAQVFAVMAQADRHTFQLLTKRPRRTAALLNDPTFHGLVAAHACGRRASTGGPSIARLDGWPLQNVWVGTSIESDRYTFRADHLRATPAAVRFLSLEPLLGALPSLDLAGIDWVIVGGESGPGARPMHPSWVRDLRDRCVAAGVPFFLKQWGAWAPAPLGDFTHHVELDGTARPRPTWPEIEALLEEGWGDTGWYGMSRVGKAAAGRILDGRTWDQMPREVGRG